MKRILIFLLCLLLVPGACAENSDTTTVTSHFERYSITLPEGSVHFPLHDAARLMGSTVASVRFNEVDCYGIGQGDYINMQTMSTPYGSIFRSDMLDYTDSLLQSFRASYVAGGYPEDRLEIELETIGQYPFVRIDVTDDPQNITEYYTYGSSGTEFCLAFLGTSIEEEHAILSTLQLAEPTEIVADYTESNLRDKTKKKLPQSSEDPFAGSILQTFDSHFGRYTIDLPKNAVHFSNETVARHYDMTTAQLKLAAMDCFSVYNDGYIDMTSTVTANMEIYPTDMTKNQRLLLSALRDLLEEQDYVEADTLTVTLETIGSRKFIRAAYRMTDSAGIQSDCLDYITYDEYGTEFYFSFYDIADEQVQSLLQTLTLLPPEKISSGSSGLSGRAAQRDADTGSTGLTRKAPQSAGNMETKDLSVETRTFESEHGYSITLPGTMSLEPPAFTQMQLLSMRVITEAAGGSTELWDTMEQRGRTAEMYTSPAGNQALMVFVAQIADGTYEEHAAQSERFLDESREELKKQKLDPDQYTVQFEQINGITFTAVHGKNPQGLPYSEFVTISEDGRQYNLSFVGISEADARAIMETFSITK